MDKFTTKRAREEIIIKRQKCTQLNVKHAKHIASMRIPVNMLRMRYRVYTRSHRWTCHVESGPTEFFFRFS